MATTDRARLDVDQKPPGDATAVTRSRIRIIDRLKRMPRLLAVAFASLAALTAVVVPTALQAHPVQNPVVLVSPADGECVDTLRPTLTWQPRQHATKYKVKVFLDYGANEHLLYYEWVHGTYNTSWTPPHNLPAGSKFHWGVKGSNDDHGDPAGYGDGPWSNAWYFYTPPC